MRLSLMIIFCIFYFVLNCFSQVILTEVMFDVVGADYHDEYIEIKNISDSETIDLSEWYLKIGDSRETMYATKGISRLSPGQYGLILDGSYNGSSNRYDRVIPDSTLILTIEDKAFGSNGLTNSKGMSIEIYNEASILQDSYTYSPDNKPGYSDEKVVLSQSNRASNWKNGIEEGGTPGKINSVSPRDRDLSLKLHSLQVDYEKAEMEGIKVFVQLNILNSGLSSFYGKSSLKIWLDTDVNASIDYNDIELVNDRMINNLMIGDSTQVSKIFIMNQIGLNQMICLLESEHDMNNKNDTVYTLIETVEYRKSLVINEIKFLTEAGEQEWIELYNTGADALSLKGWFLSDIKDTCMIDSNVSISADSYMVLASAGLNNNDIQLNNLLPLEGFPTMNNAGDTISLIHPLYGTLEYIPYEETWLEEEGWRYPSLERINPDLPAHQASNWGPCVYEVRGTPGKKNSTFIKKPISNSKIYVLPNPFSPNNDGYEDRSIISIRSKLKSARIRTVIYDIAGRKVRTLADNRYFGGQADLVWDGKDDQGNLTRMGIYFIHTLILNDREGKSEELISTVTLARPL